MCTTVGAVNLLLKGKHANTGGVTLFECALYDDFPDAEFVTLAFGSHLSRLRALCQLLLCEQYILSCLIHFYRQICVHLCEPT